jgi:hypothetical protein
VRGIMPNASSPNLGLLKLLRKDKKAKGNWYSTLYSKPHLLGEKGIYLALQHSWRENYENLTLPVSGFQNKSALGRGSLLP